MPDINDPGATTPLSRLPLGIHDLSEVLNGFTIAAHPVTMTTSTTVRRIEDMPVEVTEPAPRVSVADRATQVCDIADPDTCCEECGRTGAVNNRVRDYTTAFVPPYSSLSYTRTLCSRCVNSRFSVCNHCELIEPDVYMLEGFCRSCRVQCAECSERFASLDHGVCSDCGWYCSGCSSTFSYNHERNSRFDDDDSYCDGCWSNMRSEYDEDSEYGPGVRSYGHTHPTMWFGGPLPRDEANRRIGYYLGFELEIYSTRMNAVAIHEWAGDNGLAGFFDCKEDSSVEGFEIATQPFTPEFFETLVSDGRLDSFFEMLNANYPVDTGYGPNVEPTSHGLHVHVGRVAFRGTTALAAFSYLLAQDNGKHLERIARREPTGYCERTSKPVTQAILADGNRQTRQRSRLDRGEYARRGSINLQNSKTVEVRSFRSTRKATELADAVRLVYVGAEYVRSLSSFDPKLLAWAEFCRWTAFNHAPAFASLAGLPAPVVHKVPVPRPTGPVVPSYSVDDFAPENVAVAVESNLSEWVAIDPGGCLDRACCSHNFTRRPLRGLAAI